MKKKHIDIDRMVMESNFMDSLEREREANQTMDDMTHGDYKEQIKELKETIKNLYGIIQRTACALPTTRTWNKTVHYKNSWKT